MPTTCMLNISKIIYFREECVPDESMPYSGDWVRRMCERVACVGLFLLQHFFFARM